ncbi:hypothetical protein [Pseudomonas sp. 1152_12]|uniref:hypothetical protein n=1 Tax=Pseudomonas sp. 1152_12 TaxID=2604455 RepID=UPI0040648807
MARLLIVSHTSRHTGFGNVAVGIANALALVHCVTVIGAGPAHVAEKWVELKSDPRDIGRTSALRTRLRENSTDVVLLIGVNVLTAWQAQCVRKDGYKAILVAYVPVEGPIYKADRLAGLRACTQVVAYHPMAARALASAVPGLPVISWIFHAVRQPRAPLITLLARPTLRRKLLPGLTQHWDRVWILNANRNDHRKCPEATLRAFASIVSQRPDTTLMMHCEPLRPHINLRAERDRLGLTNNVVFTHDELPKPWSEQQLSELYAVCEIGVSSALGEGWGLIPFEHALQGGAQVLPAHPGLLDIWGGAMQWVPVGEPRPVDRVSMGHVPDQQLLAESMLALATDPVRCRQQAAACRAQAAKEQFSWETVGQQWRTLVDTLLTK